MEFPLSPRLKACCCYIQQGDRVADIGCDHGYLGIHLLKNKIAASVIAADVNEGPLESAVRNAHKYGVQENIRFCLSDGVQNIPRDFDVMVCAGMGADTMVSILEAAPWLKDSSYRLILQCQSKTPALRQYLSENGWHITRETVLRDGRFLYTVMDVSFQPDAPRLTIGQQYLSPALLACGAPELAEYYDRLLFSLNRAITGRGEQADPQMVAALEELQALNPQFKEDSYGNCQ